MSTLGRNDAFSVVGGAPNARIIEGHVSRISGLEIFVVSPTFDAGLEFGPVQYGGNPPVLGAQCIVAVMTGTTEAWLLSWSGPSAGGTPMTGAKLRSDANQPLTPTIATNTKITFDHIVRTALGYVFPTTSSRQTGIVVPKTGLYDISAQVSVIANSQSMDSFITVNGSALMTENHWASDYTGAVFSLGVFNVDRQLHTRIMLTAGDLVELWYNQQTTAPQPANGTRTWLDVLLLEAGQGPAGATGPQGPAGIPGTSLQQLTPTARSGTYTAASGDLVLMTGSFVVTLPSPALSGQVLGVRAVDARTAAAPVTITTPSGLILGQGIGVASVGAASAVLGIQNAYMLLESDGTNWHVIAGEQDTGHIAFPFAAGEGNLSGHVASYRKRGDYVTLRGMTHFTSGVAPWPIGTLPVGFRPLNSHYVLTHGTTAAGNGQNAQMLAIEATGAITLDNIAALNLWSGNYGSLAPLAFHAVN